MNIRENLKAFVDGELSPAEMALVQTAIENDPTLLQEVETMRWLGYEIRKLSNDPAPVGLEGAVQAVSARRTLRFTGVPRWGWAVATVAIAIVGISLINRNNAVPADSATAEGMPASSEKLASPTTDFALMDGAKPEFRSRGLAGADAAKAVTDEMLQSRMIIRTGDIRMKVEDAAKASEECMKYVACIGGFVQSSGISLMQGSVPVGNLVIRVPEKRFDETFQMIRALGERISETTNSDDVTLQHADVSARLKVMRAEEEQYVTLMGQAKTVGQVMEVKARLSQVRQQIESLDAQRKALERQSSLSTISVALEQRAAVGTPEPQKGWAAEAWANAVNGLVVVGKALASAAIFLFVYAPFWLPLVLLVVWLMRKAK